SSRFQGHFALSRPNAPICEVVARPVWLLKPVEVRQNRARSGFPEDARHSSCLPTCGCRVLTTRPGRSRRESLFLSERGTSRPVEGGGAASAGLGGSLSESETTTGWWAPDAA